MSNDVRGADERRLAVGAAQVLAVLAVPVAAAGGLLVGPEGALSALIGLAFVLLLFGSSALLLARVAARADAREPGDAAIGPLVAGALVRVPLYLLVLDALSGLAWVHARSLAAATALAVVVTLGYELRLLARMPRLFRIDADAGRPQAVGHPTRSESL